MALALERCRQAGRHEKTSFRGRCERHIGTILFWRSLRRSTMTQVLGYVVCKRMHVGQGRPIGMRTSPDCELNEMGFNALGYATDLLCPVHGHSISSTALRHERHDGCELHCKTPPSKGLSTN